MRLYCGDMLVNNHCLRTNESLEFCHWSFLPFQILPQKICRRRHKKSLVLDVWTTFWKLMSIHFARELYLKLPYVDPSTTQYKPFIWGFVIVLAGYWERAGYQQGLKARLSIPDLPSVKLVKNQISTLLAIINFVQSQWDACRPGIALMKTNNWPFIPMFQPVLAGYWFFSISGGPVIIKKTKLIFKQVSFFFLNQISETCMVSISGKGQSIRLSILFGFQKARTAWYASGLDIAITCLRTGQCNV